MSSRSERETEGELPLLVSKGNSRVSTSGKCCAVFTERIRPKLWFYVGLKIQHFQQTHADARCDNIDAGRRQPPVSHHLASSRPGCLQ